MLTIMYWANGFQRWRSCVSIWLIAKKLQHNGLDTQLTDVVLLWSCAKDGTRPLIFVFEQWKLWNGAWLLAKLRTPLILIAQLCFDGSGTIIRMARMVLSGRPVVGDHDCWRNWKKTICVAS